MARSGLETKLMTVKQECIADSALRELREGKLSQAEAAKVAMHVLECPTCFDRLNAIRSNSPVPDTVLGPVSVVETTAGGSAPQRVELLGPSGEESSPTIPAHASPPNLAEASDIPTSSGNPHTVSGLSEYSSTSLAAPPAPGRRFGDYDLLEEIARGGMGVVYLARQHGLNRLVAVKMILPGELSDEEAVARFRAEAEAAGQLRHPGIVAVFEVGEIGGLHYFSMEYIEGKSLASLVRKKPFAPEAAARCMQAIAEAIHYAHEQGVLHRDLKPSNVIIDSEGRPHVTDFGLAKRMTPGAAELTRTRAVMGTPSYMSPEQAAGKLRELGPRSDVYSLGAMLYELLAGRPPFRADTPLDTVLEVMQREAVSPRRVNLDTPRDLETICLKCLEKEAPRRYATAGELAADLGRFLSGDTISARPVSSIERGYRWLRRRPIVAGLAAAMVLVLVLGAVAGTLAVSNLAARHEAERVRAAAALEAELDRHLALPSLETAFVPEASALVDRLRHLDREKGVQAESKLHRSYAVFLRQNIERQRLRDEDFSAIEQALAAYRPHNEKLVDELAANLSARRRVWRETHSLQTPFDNLRHTFSPELVATDETAARRPHVTRPEKSAGEQIIPSLVTSEPNAEFEVVFDESWQSAKKLGALIGWKPADGGASAYEFLLVSSPSNPYWLAPHDSFEKCRGEQTEPLLRIVRGGEIVAQSSVPWNALPEGPITLRARRDGAKLWAQVNQQPPLLVEEIFPKDSAALGNYAVCWPQKAGLVSLRVASPIEPPKASPLDAGDRLFAGEKFSAALAEYERALESTAEPLRNEARFKRAACILALKGFDEAESLLMELATEPEGPWPIRAAFLAWLEHLKSKRFEQAEKLADFIVVRFPAKDIGNAVPFSMRSQALAIIEEFAHTAGEITGHSDARLEKAIKIYLALAASPVEQIWARSRVAQALGQMDRRKDAIAMCRELEEDPHLPQALRLSLLSEHARLLNLESRSGEAITLLTTAMSTPPLSNFDFATDLLVMRAALYGGQNQWDKARTDLDTFFEKNWSMSSYTWLHAYLLRGFVEDRAGNSDEARRIWSLGMQYLRDHVKRTNDRDLYNSAVTPVIGSLSESFTNDDIDNAFAEFLGAALPWNFVKPLFPQNFLYDVPKMAWRTPEGKALALRVALYQMSHHELTTIAVKVDIAEAWRQTIIGSAKLDYPLSDDERHVVWEMGGVMYQYFVTRKLGEVEAMFLFQAWNGQTGVFGWQALAPRLSKEIRPPLEYFLGCHYRNEGKLEDAKKFFAAALAEAAEDTPLKRLVKRDLDALSKPKEE